MKIENPEQRKNEQREQFNEKIENAAEIAGTIPAWIKRERLRNKVKRKAAEIEKEYKADKRKMKGGKIK